MSLRCFLCFLVSTLLWGEMLPLRAHAQPTEPAVDLYIGATVIAGNGNPAITDATLMVQDGHLKAIGTIDTMVFPENANRYDVAGKFIIPGLIDVHAHIQSPIHQLSLKALLAYGITTIRVPGGTDVGVVAREKVKRGDWLGPDIFAGGQLIDGAGFYGVADENELQLEIQRQYEEGVDLIKLYAGLPSDLVAAAIKEAHSLGLPVIGHLSKTTWLEAASLGIDGLVHMVPAVELLSISDFRDMERRFDTTLIENGRSPDFWKFSEKIRAAGHNNVGAILGSYINLDGPKVANLIGTLKQYGVMVDPTLVVDQSLAYGNHPQLILQYQNTSTVPSEITDFLWGENWSHKHKYIQGETGEILTSMKPVFALNKQLIVKFHQAGIKIAAGSDFGMPWMSPGASLHRELELLVEAGLSPEEVLSIATKNGSEFVYAADKIGTLEPGKAADFLILNGDPRTDIRNTRDIDLVIKGGRVYRPADLLH